MDPTRAPQSAGPYPAPLRMGQWDHMLIGAFMPVAEDQRVTNTYYGLRHTGTYFNLYLRNASGKYYFLSNAVQSRPDGGALQAGAWLFPMQSLEGGLVPDLRSAAWDGNAVQTLTPDKKIKYTVEVQGSGDEIIFDDRALAWASKNGDIILEGDLATPAMQLILPWREPSGNTDVMYYSCQYYKLDGTYMGEAVHGYCLLEHIWGTKSYMDTWWVQNRMVYWPRWITTYDDGTSEMGDMMLGEHGARGALIVNSKGEIIVNTTEFTIDAKDDGRALYSFANGPQWELIPEIRVPGLPFAIGTVKRVGETRKIVRAHALYLQQGPLRSAPAFGQGARAMR